MLTWARMRSKQASVKSLQSNTVFKCMHKAIADILRNIVKEDPPPRQKHDIKQKIDNGLATCVHALGCVVNYTMKTSLGAMIFNCNMLINVQLIAGLESMYC